MIFDSISFMAEYLYTGKPSLFMVRDSSISNKFNEFGTMVFDLLFKSYNQNDIIDFINQNVLSNNHTFIDMQKSFIYKYLKPSNDQTASLAIFNNIVMDLT
jgi:hypothetical protein